jgi:hypothetical protein
MSAVLSPCGLYRYHLSRSIGMGDRRVTFVGVNPSTADAHVDDATVRKWVGFARRWGFDRIDVVNLFAFRATDVRQLAGEADPIGPLNDDYIDEHVQAADLVVPCWGNRSKLPVSLRHRVLDIDHLIRTRALGQTKCLGFTGSGDPRHPLMLGYDTPLEAWP